MLENKKPKLLDAFCGAGGAGMGYHRAGFDVIGIDIEPQPRYPFEFHQGDALEFIAEYGQEYDMIHTSPPCQVHSLMTKGRWQHRLEKHENLIPETRAVLKVTGKPYIIENVEGAKSELINPITLCGTMFNLSTRYGSQLIRHRLFETNPVIWWPPFPCAHFRSISSIGVSGGGQHPDRRNIPVTIGVYGHSGGSSKRDNIIMFGIDERKEAMGIDWMTGDELSQAIPPAYTKWIGEQLLRKLCHPTNAMD